MLPRLPANIQTPAYVLDVAALKRNLATAARIKREAGVKILLATKAWAMPAAFPLMRDTLDGTTASGEQEARLGREEFGKEVHVYAPAYGPGEVERLVGIADHIYFNSPGQIGRHLATVEAAGRAVGIRINPGYSRATLGGALYDPCAPGSRFGTTMEQIEALPWGRIDILHTHALCEALDDGSVGLIEHVARNLGPYVRKVKAVNFGGGHFINKPGYDVGKLITALKAFRAEFGVEVILEPGAGLVVDTGWLVATVLDLHRNEQDIAILDTSASTHMPDVLEVPYRPQHHRRRRSRREGAFLYSRRQDLHDRRRDRRVLVRSCTAPRRPADLRRHDAVFVREEHDFQRHAAPRSRHARRRWHLSRAEVFRLRGFQA